MARHLLWAPDLMRFSLSHTTRYEYAQPASESFAELRVWPRSSRRQRVIGRSLETVPAAKVDHYEDYFGNHVEFFSIPYRHEALEVTARAEVETLAAEVPRSILETPLGEVRQIYNSQFYRIFDFLQESGLVPLGVHRRIRRGFFPATAAIGESLLELNHWIHRNFEYRPGVTEVFTPVAEVLKKRSGVCQDFAHLMLALLRGYRIPARYVSGYIEAHDPEKHEPGLVGAAASHAWVEVLLPGGIWWGLDPTNDQPAGERHIVVAAGRDYHDVAPMRGTFKGAADQKLQVMVSLKRGRRAA